MAQENQINVIMNNILKVDGVEESFSCFLTHKMDMETELMSQFQSQMTTIFSSMSQETMETSIKIFFKQTANLTNHSKLKKLFKLIEILVGNNVLPPRVVCESVLSCDKLVYQNQEFWIECFNLIRRIIGGVDYKGVREIMKGCREKAQTLPQVLNASSVSQLRALENVIEYIFDRNACLLPSYFIVTEIQKAYPDNKNWPHWKLANLFSSFVESFRATAQMVSVIGQSHMLPVVEHTGYADHLINPWKLDSITLKFALKGNLPYDADLLKPQTELLRYVLEQPYSRDMVCSILGLQKQHKQRCVALEEQLVALVVLAMERSEQDTSDNIIPINNPSNNSASNANGGIATLSTTATTCTQSEESSYTSSQTHWLWLHLSSQLIYFVLFQFANFSSVVTALYDKLSGRDLRKGRDHLMWVLLQFISGSIQRNPLTNFLPVLRLYDLLYPEKEPLAVPDFNKSQCTHKMAATCIWIHLSKKAQTEHVSLHRPIPLTLKHHYEFLQHLVTPNNTTLCLGSDYRIVLLCNAYSTNQDNFSRPMAALVETILGNQKSSLSSNTSGTGNASGVVGGSSSGSGSSGCSTANSSSVPIVPLSMSILDSLTVHSKMSLIHSVVTHVIKLAQTQSKSQTGQTNMAPALVETYSRLLVYTEIESLGIKGFISQLLPTVFKSHAWGILFTLLEMFSYRMHHIQPHYRVQLLSHLHSLAAVPQTNQTQLHLCVESTALRLITGLGSHEVQPQLSRFLSEPKALVSAESEELNRALVLTLARSMHVTGTGSDNISGAWCKELLNTIMQNTPHSWANHTLQCFPNVLVEFFTQNPVPKENTQQLKKSVDEEFRNWSCMSNENDIIAHFSVAGTPPLFLCLLWKMILETDRVSVVAYKILERIGARALSAHLRKFCDYFVFEVTNSAGQQQVNKCVDTINDMIWKYNIITIDRLVLCLALRTQEGSEAQVCFFIIQLLLLKASEVRNRVHDFVKENSPEHWKQSNWHEKHLAFHRKYPEKFAPEESNPTGSYSPLPVLFGNVCLRFLPVFDIVIHRYLEISAVRKSLEILLDHLGCLYKFHDRPVTYLYNTLHYYERKIRDSPPLKRRLVSAILGSMKDIRPPNWALSESYQAFLLKQENEAVLWIPDLSYYIALVRRMVDTMSGAVNHFAGVDWRFNEFPNAAAHVLYTTCVELMGLPVGPTLVANGLLDVLSRGYTVIPSRDIYSWINCIGLILASLPESYWSILHERLLKIINSKQMVQWSYRHSPFFLYNFAQSSQCALECEYSLALASAHAVWHHAGPGHIAQVPKFIKEINARTEAQLLFVCHLVGPFLQRYNSERPRAVIELALALYEQLEQVDKAQQHLEYMDPICDLLYHIKYMFVGDMMRSEVEPIVRRLRPALQMRLRFIAHLNIEDISSSTITCGSTISSTNYNLNSAQQQQLQNNVNLNQTCNPGLNTNATISIIASASGGLTNISNANSSLGDV